VSGKLGTALGSLEDVVKFNTNEINVFLVDPLCKELTRVRAPRRTVCLPPRSCICELGVTACLSVVVSPRVCFVHTWVRAYACVCACVCARFVRLRDFFCVLACVCAWVCLCRRSPR
jgi:hypothetical protein